MRSGAALQGTKRCKLPLCALARHSLVALVLTSIDKQDTVLRAGLQEPAHALACEPELVSWLQLAQLLSSTFHCEFALCYRTPWGGVQRATSSVSGASWPASKYRAMAGPVHTRIALAAGTALLLALSGTLLVPGAAAACGKTHPYVGFSGDLTTMDHNVRALCLKTSTQPANSHTYPHVSTKPKPGSYGTTALQTSSCTCIIARQKHCLKLLDGKRRAR